MTARLYWSTMQALLDEARKLAPNDRIALAEKIMETIGESDVPDLSVAQQSELDRRMARIAASGSNGTDWEVVKRDLLSSALFTALPGHHAFPSKT